MLAKRYGITRWTMLGPGALVLAVVAACSTEPAPRPVAAAVPRPVATEVAAADGVLRVGAVLARTGILATEEADLIVAVRDAVAWQNARGGIGGRPVELVETDSGSSLVQAARVAAEIIDSGADVLVVGCDLDLASTVARVARRSGRLAVSSCVADDAFGVDTAGTSAFAFAPLASAIAEATAQRLLASGVRIVTTVSSLLPYESTGMCQRFSDRFRALGGSVVAEVEIAIGEPPSALGLAVADLPPAAAIVSCVSRAGVSEALRSLRSTRNSPPIVALLDADGLPWPSGTVDGVTFATTANLWPPDAALAPLVAAGARSGLALRTFVAVDVLAQAIAATSPIAGARAWADALRTTTFATALGPVRFDTRQRALDLPVIFARTNAGGAEATPAR